MAIRVQSGMVLQAAGAKNAVRGVQGRDRITMNYRRIAGLIGGAAAGAAVVGAEIAQAQDNTGSTVDLGGSIADTVTGAVSDIATSSGGTASGGTRVESNEINLGEQEGLAISDASGGNNNISFVS
jgi:hypothetical protein